MDRAYLHHLWRGIRPIRAWYFLITFVLFSSLAVVMLRENYLGMVSRRNAVYQADQNNGDVEGALQHLRSYVAAHMNTNLSSGNSGVYPPIQLKYTYDRLQKAEQDRVTNANKTIYNDAQNYCEQLYPADVSISGRARVPCIEDYVSAHGQKARTIPDALYKFDFASASWSPDLAGISLVLAVLSVVLLILRLAVGHWLKKRVE